MSFMDMKCVMCGQRFDPDQHAGCAACPLHEGCSLVCCPNCGHQTVNPQKSKFARLVQSFFTPRNPGRSSTSDGKETTLAEVMPGCLAEITGFADGFPADRRAYLQAYGLVVNYWVQVLQHSPVTIVKLDHIELALESDLAKGILVKTDFSVDEKPIEKTRLQ